MLQNGTSNAKRTMFSCQVKDSGTINITKTVINILAEL